MFCLCSAAGGLCPEQHCDWGKEKMQERRLRCSLWTISMIHWVQRLFAQAGERLMVDVCTHCECNVENGAMKKYRLSCRRISCPTCPMVTVTPLKDYVCYCLSSLCLTIHFIHPSLSKIYPSPHALLKLHDDSSHYGVYYGLFLLFLCVFWWPHVLNVNLMCTCGIYRTLMTGVLQGYTLQKEADTCCGRCIPTACIMQRLDGSTISLEVEIWPTASEEKNNCRTCRKRVLMSQQNMEPEYLVVYWIDSCNTNYWCSFSRCTWLFSSW